MDPPLASRPWRTLYALAGLLLALSIGFTGCVGVSPAGIDGNPSVRTIRPSGQELSRFWVLRTSWHTGLVLTRAEMGKALSHLLAPLPRGRYWIFGWGDRRYYLARHPSSGVALGALWPSTSVLLVQSCQTGLAACFGQKVHLRAVRITPLGLIRLRRYLVHSLSIARSGQALEVAVGPFPQSEFFASPLTYDAFHTCNTWTAHALATGGLPVEWSGVLFAGQVWAQLPRDRRVKPSE